MISGQLHDDSFRSPSLYLDTISEDLEFARFCVFAPKDYSALPHSIQHASGGLILPVAELLRISRTLPVRPPIRFIFTTELCCSTLLIRALGKAPSTLSLNEPRVFSALSRRKRALDIERDRAGLAGWEEIVSASLRFLNRGFRPGQAVIVKEGALTNYISSDLLELSPRSPALFLYSSLERYVAAVLGMAARRRAVRFRVEEVLTERSRHGSLQSLRPERLCDEQAAALHWILQVMAYRSLIRKHPKRNIRSLDCDDFLRSPREGLWQLGGLFGCEAIGRSADAVIGGVLRKHSKLSSRSFDRRARDAEFERLRRRFAPELKRALRWADRLKLSWNPMGPLPKVLQLRSDFP